MSDAYFRYFAMPWRYDFASAGYVAAVRRRIPLLPHHAATVASTTVRHG